MSTAPELKFEVLDQSEAEKLITQRLQDALEWRTQFETQWRSNELMLFSNGSISDVSVSYTALSELFTGDLDTGDSAMSINYMFKYLRYIHAQMSANPPSVVPRPTSQDQKDKRAAEVADHLVGYARRQYKAQDKVDLMSLQTLCYGSGWIRVGNDPHAGKVVSVNKEKRTLKMSGDLYFRPKLIWDIAPDHTAKSVDEIGHIFERHLMPVEKASYLWPEYKEKFEAEANKQIKGKFWDQEQYTNFAMKGKVAIWEYTEKALPWNGMAGRHCFMLGDKTFISQVEENKNPDACLGYHLLTDVDVPGQFYGKTFIDYLVRLQDILNRLDSTVLDNIQAHGNVRMVVYDAAENQDGLPSTSGWQIMNVKGTAAQKPDFINPPTLMPDIYRFREQLLAGMEQLAGVNESMFGQVKREMSGFSLQTAINAGNMVRRRLFNKYALVVEAMYEDFLSWVKQEWTDARKILVTGQEGALSVAYYSGADIADGYDLDVEYGASFSLDPSSRREEIMQIMPMLKEAGFSMKSILGMLKLNDISGLFDLAEMSSRRQLEIFDEMIATFEEAGVLTYIKPEKLEEHQGMLAAAYIFRSSMAFKVLPKPLRTLIDQHIMDREAMAAEAAAPGGGGIPQIPGMGAAAAGAAAGPMPAVGMTTPPAEGIPA